MKQQISILHQKYKNMHDGTTTVFSYPYYMLKEATNCFSTHTRGLKLTRKRLRKFKSPTASSGLVAANLARETPPGYPPTGLLAPESEGCPHPGCNEIKPGTQPRHLELKMGQLQGQRHARGVEEPDSLLSKQAVESEYD